MKTEFVGIADGLRALAIICVVLSHVAALLRLANVPNQLFYGLGFWGVSAFFVLSGFLLGRPYVESILGTRRPPDAALYARRRFLRIWPAYALVVCVSSLLEDAHHGEHFASFGDVALHLTMLHGFVAQSIFGAGNAPLWTMAVDAQFYVLLPLAAYALTRGTSHLGGANRIRVIIATIAGSALLSLAWRIIMVAFVPIAIDSPEHIFEFQRGVFGMGLAFCLGGALALFRTVRPPLKPVAATGSIVLGSALGILTINVLNIMPAHAVAYASTVMDVLGAWSIAFLLLGALDLAIFDRISRLPVVTAAATVAYALYLVHHPILHTVYAFTLEHRANPGITRVATFLSISGLACVISAFALHRFIERPFLLMKERARERSI